MTNVRTSLAFIKMSVKMLSKDQFERRTSTEVDLRKEAGRPHLWDGESPIARLCKYQQL
jgi:hypothetical protein